MRTFPRAAQAAASICLCLSLLSPAPAVANDALLIADVREAWTEAINTRDVDSLLGLYGPGAVVFPEGSPPQLGAGAICDWLGRWSAAADVHYVLDAGITRIDGDRALEEWSAEVTVLPRAGDDADVSRDPLQFHQTGVRVYRKDADGRWRIDRETWSADHPTAIRLLGE